MGHGGASGPRTVLHGSTGRVFSTAVLGGQAVTLADGLQRRLLITSRLWFERGCPALGTFP